MRLTEKQVMDIIFEDSERFTIEEQIYDEPRRWTRSVVSIIKDIHTEKCYSIKWEEALTENQENYSHDQDAVEVHQVEETIVVKRWVPVG